MTEQPDTAAIRAVLAHNPAYLDLMATIRALCDALDAARAQRDAWADRGDLHLARAEAAEAERDDLRREGDWKANQAWARCSHAHKAAEAAEARIAEYEEKLTRAHDDREAAEARIAAALADHWCQTCDDSGPCHTVRALTEGTGQ